MSVMLHIAYEAFCQKEEKTVLGDCQVGAPYFPMDDGDIKELKEKIVKACTEKFHLTPDNIVIINIIRLGV